MKIEEILRLENCHGMECKECIELGYKQCTHFMDLCFVDFKEFLKSKLTCVGCTEIMSIDNKICISCRRMPRPDNFLQEKKKVKKWRWAYGSLNGNVFVTDDHHEIFNFHNRSCQKIDFTEIEVYE